MLKTNNLEKKSLSKIINETFRENLTQDCFNITLRCIK